MGKRCYGRALLVAVQKRFREDLAGAIRAGITTAFANQHTTIPGTIVDFDPKTQTATIQPEISKTQADGSKIKMPPLMKVQYEMPTAGNFHITQPVGKGDQVIVTTHQTGADQFLEKGDDQISKEENRYHSLSDSSFRPTNISQDQAVENFNSDHMQIRSRDGKTTLELQQGGRFRMAGEQYELFAVMGELLDVLIAAQTDVASGSSAGAWNLTGGTISALNNVKSKITSISG